MAREARRGGIGSRSPAAVARTSLVPHRRLRWRCPLSAVPADPTSGSRKTVGQDRALEALRLGLGVRAPGYNIFVSGLSGTGRTTTVLQMVRELAPTCPVPRDRAYVHNFADANRPRLLTLAAGRASALARDIAEFTAFLRRALPGVLEDREFHRRRDDILKRSAREENDLLGGLRARLGEEGFALVEIESEGMKRLEIFPVLEGKPVPMDRYRALAAEGKIPEAEFQEREAEFLEFRRDLAQVLRRHRELARNMNDEVEGVLRETVSATLAGALEDLRARNTEPAVHAFLAAVEADVLDHILPLAREASGGEEGDGGGRFDLYRVHVLLDRRGQEGCSIVHDTAPSLAGTFGTIDRRPVGPGMFVADHTMIRAGTLLEADGGFLVLAAEEAFGDPEVATALRRVLRHRLLEIRGVDSLPGLPSVGLAPEAIEIDVKVILVGDWRLYHLLHGASTEFAETFRVKADFEPDMDATKPNIRHFCRVVGRIAAEATPLSLERGAYAALAEHGVRLSGRQGKVTTRFGDVGDLVREGAHRAAEAGAEAVAAAHVKEAVAKAEDRNRLPEDRVQDLIHREILLVETAGRRVGRVNGLSVHDLGYHAFGKPTVITATTGVGQAGIINVEREARLSGGIYDKGVLIIAGYLRRTFAQDRPLALTASVCFEQSYAGVDGDSASVAEVAALVSELSGVAVDQGIAVTGSLNQHGDVQPIGGVNEKVEGFFDVCRRRGLTGEQGVVLPRANVGDLMLREDVVEACRGGRFHVWAVSRVEEAVALLLGVRTGTRGRNGRFPPGTLFRAVDDRLIEYVRRLSGREDWKPVPGGAEAAATPRPAPRASRK